MTLASSLPAPPKRRSRRKILTWSFLVVFLLPVFGAAGALAYRGGPTHWSRWDRTVVSRMPAAASHPEARVLVMTGRTRGWKGAVAVHSWVVIKRENDRDWRRYDVAGWGSPVRLNWWPPDSLVRRARRDGRRHQGRAGAGADPAYRGRDQGLSLRQRMATTASGPGPNSNTFVATVLRAVPELGAMLPPNAVGRDFRPYPYAGLTDSGTGIETSLWGLLGVKLGWVEGVEVNLLGLVAGFDLRHPALKVPGLGRIGLDGAVTTAVASGT